jgi:flagellar hook-associated protein 1 FlgK
MTSLTDILNIGVTGLQTAQTGLTTVSNNVSNVNTPGFVQTAVDQTTLTAGAQGAGVSVADIKRITNQYLQAASYAANAASASATAVSGSLGQAESLFGDPTTSGSLFANLDATFSAFSAMAANTTSAAGASAASQANLFFSQASNIASSIATISTTADQQISSDVGTVNQLLGQISQLNTAISRGSAAGQDVTGAQNQQGQLLTQLSSLMDVKVNATPLGGVSVLASSGATLVGSAGASTLAYNATGPTGVFTLTNPQGVAGAFNGQITSGEIGGLTNLRNSQLPAVSAQLAALVQGAATTLNNVHNAYSAVPPPTTLTGQNTGLDLPTIAGDFTGKTTIALVNKTSGAIDHTVAVDFSARTITVDGGAATGFTAATFGTALNTAMGGVGGSASFANGALTLTGTSTDGVAIKDDATTPATDGGRGFSAFFGLNNLVSSGSITNFNTGLKATDASGFAAGQTITLRLSDAKGNKQQDVTVTTPGGTVASLMSALNTAGTGVGAYGSFSLSGSGALTFTPNASGASVSVVSDQTSNTATGASVSQLFGIGVAAQSSAAATYVVRPDILQNSALLATASLNLSAGAGVAALTPGDGSGADALGQAGLASMSFPAVSGVAATTTTLSAYSASIAAAIANASASASTAKTTTSAVATNANTALSSVEGVNIDQELINLTTYQQAYNASARMIQAANSLFSTLLTMTTGV